MKTLDILRHATRQKPGTSLSQDGVELARYVGRTLGPYKGVVTSGLPRAAQTAAAMGFAPTGTDGRLGRIEDDIVERTGWPDDLSTIDRRIADCAACRAFAEAQAALWEEIAGALAEGAGLIISHGAIMELGAIATLHRTRQPITGEAFAYCEGVRLHFDDQACVRVEQLRLPAGRRLVSN